MVFKPTWNWGGTVLSQENTGGALGDVEEVAFESLQFSQKAPRTGTWPLCRGKPGVQWFKPETCGVHMVEVCNMFF